MKILNLENLSKFYKSAETVSVGMKNVSASFDIGEFVAITGESGSGKSTLLNVISGLDGYEEGELYHYGEETSHYTISDWETYRSAYIGFVFQNYNIIDSYTVYQNVYFALEMQGYPKESRRKRALELIDRVGLTSHKNHKASKLSGGQKQRTVLARALAKDTPIIVADEPTGNLDSESAKQVMTLLHELSKDKLVIVVTHDYSQVEPYATRRIKMHDGTIAEDIILKEHEIVEEPIKIEAKKVPFTTLLKISFRNIFSTPKRTIFMLFLQVLVIGIFTVMYSSQAKINREAGLQSSMIYPNAPETRLLVERRDGEIMEAEELTKFANNKDILAVYKNSYLFYDNRALQFDLINNENNRGFHINKTDSSVVLKEKDVKGRIPSAINEVVLSSYYGLINIGDVIGLSYSNYYYYYDESNEVKYFDEFIVVGLDELERDTIYFSEAYLNKESLSDKNEAVYDALTATIRNNLRLYADNSMNITYKPIYIEDSILEHDVQMIKNNGSTEEYLKVDDVTFSLYTRYYDKMFSMVLSDVFTFGKLENNYQNNSDGTPVLVSEEFNIKLEAVILSAIESLEDEYMIDKNLIAITVEGYKQGDKFMDSIDHSVYKVYYPANLSSPFKDVLVFVQRLTNGILLFFVAMFLYAIVHAVSKNVMAGRKKDFAIFRSIGTNQAMLAKMVVLEQVILNMIGFVITLLGLFLLRNYFSFIANSLPYMNVRDYITLAFIFLLLGVWLGLRFNKKVFDQSVITVLTQAKGEY